MSKIQVCPHCGNHVEGKRIQSYSKKVAKTGVKSVVNDATSVGATGTGAYIGTLFCPGLGTAIGAGLGFLGSTIFHTAVNDTIDAAADVVTDADYEFTCPKCGHQWKRDAKKIDNDAEKIIRIIAETLHIDYENSLFLSLEELGADDSDVIEICKKLESDFGIDIPDGTIEKSSYGFDIIEYITGERVWDEDFIDDLRESFEDDEEMTPSQRKLLDHIRQSIVSKTGYTKTVEDNNGCKYTGSFSSDGIKCGQGTFIWPDGRKLEGTWKDNNPLEGTLYYTDGSRYVGQFNENWLRHGKGIFYSKDGIELDGTWEENSFIGDEVAKLVKYSNGDKYEGTLSSEGLRSGNGVYYFCDGRKLKGVWEDDKLIQGTLKYNDGSRYEGHFNENYQRHGYGTFYSNDGSIINGTWHNDRAVQWSITKAKKTKR